MLLSESFRLDILRGIRLCGRLRLVDISLLCLRLGLRLLPLGFCFLLSFASDDLPLASSLARWQQLGECRDVSLQNIAHLISDDRLTFVHVPARGSILACEILG